MKICSCARKYYKAIFHAGVELIFPVSQEQPHMGVKVKVYDVCLARGSSQGDGVTLLEHSWAFCLTCLKQPTNQNTHMTHKL